VGGGGGGKVVVGLLRGEVLTQVGLPTWTWERAQTFGSRPSSKVVPFPPPSAFATFWLFDPAFSAHFFADGVNIPTVLLTASHLETSLPACLSTRAVAGVTGFLFFRSATLGPELSPEYNGG
jgi:hypothetical protein